MQLSILLVGDAEIRRLNRTWRGKDRATDVLSFPQPHEPGNGPVLGDVVISMEMAVRRAKQDGRPVGRELDRYLAHGVLHLLGFDHEKPAEAKRMAEREEALIGTVGLIGTALQWIAAGRAGRSVPRSVPQSVPKTRGARGRAVKAGAGRRRPRK
jgi:probable rRNA maturation factor